MQRWLLACLILLHAAPAHADCWQTASGRADINWCTGASAGIKRAKLDQILGDLKKKYADDKNFQATLMQSQEAWEKGMKASCDLIEQMNGNEGGSGPLECQDNMLRDRALFLNDLLACNGEDYGVTSQEMIDCSNSAKSSLLSSFKEYNAQISPGVGTTEDWDKQKALQERIKQARIAAEHP